MAAGPGMTDERRARGEWSRVERKASIPCLPFRREQTAERHSGTLASAWARNMTSSSRSDLNRKLYFIPLSPRMAQWVSREDLMCALMLAAFVMAMQELPLYCHPTGLTVNNSAGEFFSRTSK